MKTSLRIAALAAATATLLALSTAALADATTDAAAKEPGAVVTATGLVYRALKEGSGASPTAADSVKVHYKGWFDDGKEFDSSAKLTCPAAIAYGARGAGGVIPPNATLLFEVELLAINK